MISLDYLATSHPDIPIQKPTLDCFKAAASLIPSAVTDTIALSSCNPTINVNLSSGMALAKTLSLEATYLKAYLL